MSTTTPSPSPAPGSKASPRSKPPPSPTAGTKRKRTTGNKLYAVKKGSKPGIYYSWPDCLAQITGFKGAICKFLLARQTRASRALQASRRTIPCRWILTFNAHSTVQSFLTFEDANAFLSGAKVPSANASAHGAENTRFYGVQRGRVPGVYTDWTAAQDQIRGFTRPRYRKFSTREEAEEFVNAGKEGALVSLEFGAPGMTAENPRLADGMEITAGEGPLPPGAEDGFDPNVLLDPSTGKLVYKTVAKKSATKTQAAGIPGMLRIYTDGSSLRNGTKLASAGVGVYFGPGDSRFVTFLEQPRFGQVILTRA